MDHLFYFIFMMSVFCFRPSWPPYLPCYHFQLFGYVLWVFKPPMFVLCSSVHVWVCSERSYINWCELLRRTKCYLLRLCLVSESCHFEVFEWILIIAPSNVEEKTKQKQKRSDMGHFEFIILLLEGLVTTNSLYYKWYNCFTEIKPDRAFQHRNNWMKTMT